MDGQMNAEDALRAIGEEECLGDVQGDWDASMAELPAGALPFLTPGEIAESCRWSGLEEDVERVMRRVARAIAADAALRRLAWHCWWRVFRAPEPAALGNWPSFAKPLGDEGAVFYLLVGAAMPRLARAFHASLGLPEQVTRDTCRQVRCYCDTYRFGNDGRLGIHVRPLPWLRHYTREPYFRLGRLEYWLRPNPSGPVVYRHRGSGEVIALAEDGVRFTGEGYVWSDAKPGEVPAGWTATLEETEATVAGFPISPYGMGLRQRVTLDLSEWKCVLRKGDQILQVHIPSGGGLTPEAASHTVRRAVEFFGEHFPDSAPAAIVCGSWVFNNQLETFLPPEANLVRFLQELYLFPVPSGPQAGLWFIFLQDDLDPAALPRKTGLQRAVADFLAAGNTWRVGGMFILVDDVPHFGSQHYRSHWPPKALARVLAATLNRE